MQATVFSVSMRRGTCDVVLSVAMLSQHATWNERHMHMARRKRVMVPRPCSCGMMENKPNSPLLVDAREGRLSVLLACCLVCGMQRRRMGIVRRERDMIRYMGAPCTMLVVGRLSPVAKAKAGLARCSRASVRRCCLPGARWPGRTSPAGICI